MTVFRMVACCQDWLGTVTIFENSKQGGSFLSAAIDKNGDMHFVWGGDIYKVTIPDSIYYLQKSGTYQSNPISLCCDANVFSISTAIDNNDILNVVWRERKGDYLHFDRLYYSRIKNMRWAAPVLVQNFEKLKYKPSVIKMLSLPDGSLLAYWNLFRPSGTWFTYYDNDHWGQPFKPFPQYNEDIKNHLYGMVLTTMEIIHLLVCTII